MLHYRFIILPALIGLFAIAPAFAQPAAYHSPPSIAGNTLTVDQQRLVDAAIDRAVAWLISQQQADGSFAGPDVGQPGITSLAALAILSRGYLPGQGPQGRALNQAIKYVLDCRREDGLISLMQPGGEVVWYQASHTAIYNHAISGLLLAEVYGMTDRAVADRVGETLQRAVRFSLKQWPATKRRPADRGGWRYLSQVVEGDGDLSVTSWQLMFLRSAKNAGLEVDSQVIDRSLGFVERCFDDKVKTFLYMPSDPRGRYTRATAGAGILSLAMAGRHDTDMAHAAGNWLIRQPIEPYNVPLTTTDRYHYGLFYATAALYQLGGRYWQQFHPQLTATLVKHQKTDGSWQRESHGNRVFGQVFTTSLSVMALTAPDEVLPIFQR